MVVLDPVELEIINYDKEGSESLDAENNQEDDSYGKRKSHFQKICI